MDQVQNRDQNQSEQVTAGLPVEVDVTFAAKYLGTSERTILNYLKSRQIEGEKVGKKWFIKTCSLLGLRRTGEPLSQVRLPPQENPKSLSQHLSEQRKAARGPNSPRSEPWSFQKKVRNPLGLRPFAKLAECLGVLCRDQAEFSGSVFEFFRQGLLEIADDLSAGYYSFGQVKRKLYGRARLRAGRIVGRAILEGLPEGLRLLMIDLTESIALLCRRMDRPKAKA